MKKKYYLSDEQVESIIKLINDERELNIANGDEAYNMHWENIIMAFGYAVIHKSNAHLTTGAEGG